MKKLVQDCVFAALWAAICTGIAVVMGLIEAHDNKKNAGGKRRPLGPTTILVYTAEWIRKITHKVVAVFHPAEDQVREVSQDELNEILRCSGHFREIYAEAMHVSLDDLEEMCDPVAITEEREPIIITD